MNKQQARYYSTTVHLYVDELTDQPPINEFYFRHRHPQSAMFFCPHFRLSAAGAMTSSSASNRDDRFLPHNAMFFWPHCRLFAIERFRPHSARLFWPQRRFDRMSPSTRSRSTRSAISSLSPALSSSSLSRAEPGRSLTSSPGGVSMMTEAASVPDDVRTANRPTRTTTATDIVVTWSMVAIFVRDSSSAPINNVQLLWNFYVQYSNTIKKLCDMMKMPVFYLFHICFSDNRQYWLENQTFSKINGLHGLYCVSDFPTHLYAIIRKVLIN